MHAPPPVERSIAGELRRLVHLGWPVVLAQLGWMAMGVVDTIMVGHLGKEALGGIALGHTWSFAILIVCFGTAMGLDPVMAQAFGAGRREAAGRALVQGGVLMGVLAVPAIGLHLLGGPGLALLGQPDELVPLAGAYTRVLALSVLPMLAFSVLRQFLQAAGRMGEATAAVLVANGVNVVANAVLIYGVGGIGGYGAIGTAWATLASRIVMLIVLVVLGRGLVRSCWAGLAPAADWRAVRRLAAIGLPVGLQTGTEVWAFNLTSLMMGWLGTTAVAAHTVALNLVSVAFMVPLGISAAASTRVGNLLGAGLEWKRAGWTAVGLGVGVMALSGSLFALFPEPLARLYTGDAEVIALAVLLLPFAAAFQVFDGAQVVLFGVLRGAGDTRAPMVANLLGYWLFGLPMGAWLAFGSHWGPVGLWTGLSLSLATVASLLVLRLRWTAGRGGFRVAAE